LRLKGKVALVTGAGTGIGQATAVLFAEEGADVVAANLELPEAEETAEAVRKTGRRAIAIGADISKPDEIDAMVDRAINEFGGINILVNNAGLPAVPVPNAFEIKGKYIEAWDRVFEVNVRASFLCCQRAGQWMTTHGGGKIINVASQTGIAGVPYVNAYGPSKAAVINMTRSLAVEWAKYRINVNCVAPCWTRTRRLEKAIEKGVVSLEEIQKRCPMGRPAEPEDVAKAILFLASDDASFITGITLPVDGGWLAYGYQTV
jgi:NAD(P)-dependent dehydrogenase (short-subunit alcohol dehydrogenase family)